MKKVFFTLTILVAFGFMTKTNAQCNPNVPVITYNPSAPFIIDGLVNDWETNLLGTGSGNPVTPYTPPATSAANWSQDGVNGVDDLDTPTPPRDMRFFSYTKDATNVWFYFRRINNGNSQNRYYYFLDITSNNGTSLIPDGFMNNGEPVIEVQFNSGSINSYKVMQYVVDPAVDHVAGKGNYMVSPINGLADGYDMVGDVIDVTLPTCTGAVFAAAVTELGYGIEFTVPFCYLKNYSTNVGPINVSNVFTYHVSLTNGSGVPGTVDNAGGCCAGVAVSDNPLVTPTGSVATPIPGQTKARAFITYTNQRAAQTSLVLNFVKFKLSLFTPGGAGTVVAPMTITVWPDASCSNPANPGGTGTVYVYNAIASASTPDTAVFTPSTLAASVVLSANGTGCFVAIADFANSGVKTARMIFASTAQYTSIPTGLCLQQINPQNDNVQLNMLTTLPVKFSLFTADRINASTASIKWETTSEQNSKGFAIESNTGAGWQQVVYIPSQASGGTSNDLLSYSYNDPNSNKGITEYRIRQVDVDNQSKYTETKIVRGVSQKSDIIVYPNPSQNGKVTVVFEESNDTRDATLVDMNGRVIRQWKGVTNNIQIENLQAGMYALRVTIRETGEQTVEKIMVNKH